MKDEVDFLPADKHESLLQIDTMILMGIVRHPQSSPDSKLTMSLQYLKKEVRDKVDFWHVDKHQSFVQVGFNTLGIKDAYKVIPHEKINRCLTDIKRCLTNIFKI